MQHHKDQGMPELQDAAPTIQFINRINSVVEAMNSQQPCVALKPDPNSTHFQVITQTPETVTLSLFSPKSEIYKKINSSFNP